MYWTESMGRVSLTISLADAESASHQGRCDEDVAALRRKPYIAEQLAKWDPEEVRAALNEYGAWDADELADDDENVTRMLWLACCDVKEEAASGRYDDDFDSAYDAAEERRTDEREEEN